MSPFIWVAKVVALFALAQTTAAQPLKVFNPNSTPFKTSYLFTAEVQLGPPPKQINTNPITIPGGVLVPESILGGRVSGPFLNATISAGLATPRVYQNGTLQVPVIDLYGVTDDGFPFSLHETGIGSPDAQMTQIDIQIGGGSRYDIVRNKFILAAVNPNTERTIVNVQGYLVENTASL